MYSRTSQDMVAQAGAMLSWTMVAQAGGYVIMGCVVLLYKIHGDLIHV